MADLTFSQGADPVTIFNDLSGHQLAINTDGSINVQATISTSPLIDVIGASVDVDEIHYLTDSGLYFFFQDYATGIGNGSSRDILVITANNGKGIHCRFNFATLGGTYNLYESPTTTANGTAISVLNRNRTSSNVASLAAYSVPTVTAVGTLLATCLLGSTSRSSTADYLNSNEQMILKPNTKYLIRFNSTSGSNISVAGLNFYEV
jgi:hypothetical protein